MVYKLLFQKLQEKQSLLEHVQLIQTEVSIFFLVRMSKMSSPVCVLMIFFVLFFVARLTTFDPTDSDWPSVLRVHPILDWSYNDIWDFLRILRVGWCELYNAGYVSQPTPAFDFFWDMDNSSVCLLNRYTSLGSTYNTKPNPYLITPTGWKPAWELEDGTLERAGRSSVNFRCLINLSVLSF